MIKFTSHLAAMASLMLTGLAGCSDTSDESKDVGGFAGAPAPEGKAAEEIAETSEISSRSTEKSVPAKCGISEDVLFSCKVDGGKQLSVCGTNNNGGEPFAQYRFGKGNSELTVDYGEFSSVPYSGGGEAQIAFKNGDTRYIVFSRIVRTNFEPDEPNYPEITDGVMVVQPGKKVTTILCEGGQAPNSVDVIAGANYGGVGDEVFYADE